MIIHLCPYCKEYIGVNQKGELEYKYCMYCGKPISKEILLKKEI